jgi:hypothetical protein
VPPTLRRADAVIEKPLPFAAIAHSRSWHFSDLAPARLLEGLFVHP